MMSGITNRETYMLRYSYCCLVRCFDIMKNHPKCNGTISIEGGSQGGWSLAGVGRLARRQTGARRGGCAMPGSTGPCSVTRFGGRTLPRVRTRRRSPKSCATTILPVSPIVSTRRCVLPWACLDFCAPAEGIFTAFNALPRRRPARCLSIRTAAISRWMPPISTRAAARLKVPRWQGTDADNKLTR